MWAKILDFKRIMTGSGEFDARRRQQAVASMHDLITGRLLDSLRAAPEIAARMPELEAAVGAGRMTPAVAVEEILELWQKASAAPRPA